MQLMVLGRRIEPYARILRADLWTGQRRVQEHMQTEAPRELEAKFALSKQEELDALANSPDLPDGFSIGDSQVVSVADAYLDTRDMRLLRHGYTVRLRKKGDKRLITLKSLEEMHGGHIQDRMEIEKPLASEKHGADPAGWHEEIQRFVRDIAGERPQLQPVCFVIQTRHKEWLHHGQSDSALAELSLDQVAVSGGKIDDDGRGEPSATGPSSRFFEVELEMLDPTQEQAFFTLVQWLESRGELSPVRSSKLVSGLRAIAAQPLDTPAADSAADSDNDRSGIQPEMKMAEACRLIWRQQMTEMILNESGVRDGKEIEYVHAMRVSTRRARAAYVLLGEYFVTKQVKDHVRFFKRTAKQLGAVRDMDVALQKLTRYRKRLPREVHNDLNPLLNHWRKQRRTAMKRLRKWLDDDGYAQALIALDAFCRTPGAGTRRRKLDANVAPPLDQVRHVLPSRILTRFEAVRRYETIFAQQQRPPLATLHALRIDCKYLRYVLEFSQDLLGEEGATLIDQLKRLQDVLGDLNDADVAHTMLHDLPAPIRSETITAYAKEQKAIMDDLCDLVPQTFFAFIDPQNRRLLAGAIAAM